MNGYISATSWIRAIRKELDTQHIKPINKRIANAVNKGYLAGVTASPVCTGYLRASWRVTLNSPARAAATKTAKCKPGARTDLHSSLYAANRSSSFASTKRFNITKHTSIFITNTAPYFGKVGPRYSLEDRVRSAIKSNL
jgi:hypothetical protein